MKTSFVVGRIAARKAFDGVLVDKAGIDAEARQDVAEQLLRRAEDAARGDDVLARFHQGHYGAQDRRHAGGGGNAGLGAFERRQPLLHRGDRGIGEARVNVARLGAGETRRRLRRVFERRSSRSGKALRSVR
jgi:hypothetical protein